jgi:nucleoside-diphosphate-sugar epimerase
MAKILIVGCGYVGSELARRLVSSDHEVFGLRRDPQGLPEGVHPLSADVTSAEGIGALPPRLEFAVYCVGAKSREQARYRAAYLDGLGNLLRVLGDEGQQPKRILFTSSTSVYAQVRGEWVDEASPTHPRNFSGEIMLACERLLAGSRFPATSIRFGGLYGPGRTSLVDGLRTGKSPPLPESPHYTNRIHLDDAAGILAHMIERPDPGPLYLGVDCEPTDQAVVVRGLADALGVDPPRSTSDAPRRAGSKRCSNALLLESGYIFSHPSWREGYSDLIREPAGKST